jgi:hypothetical protein
MPYFALLYRLGGQRRYMIWVSNDTDYVAVNAEGLLLSFPSLATLRQYADAKGWPIEPEEPILHDLDAVASWVLATDSPVNCVETLAAWNLFCDVANSVSSPNKKSFEMLNSQLGRPIYDKLFWGNNLPAMTPEGEHFVPAWSKQEVKSIAALLSAGLEMFSSCIVQQLI